MDKDFLEYLARQRHSMKHYLYTFKPQALTSEECYNRIINQSKYQTILEVIAMLSPADGIAFNEIYNDLFPKET